MALFKPMQRWFGVPSEHRLAQLNPFGENLCSYEFQLDHQVELGIDRYKRDIAEAERFVEQLLMWQKTREAGAGRVLGSG
ncbi:MAG TPA: hypothetical protein VJV78_17960 [Polyangiales bacterium]|nr:hypothetical protein [Polyangiales bacterium]